MGIDKKALKIAIDAVINEAFSSNPSFEEAMRWRIGIYEAAKAPVADQPGGLSPSSWYEPWDEYCAKARMDHSSVYEDHERVIQDAFESGWKASQKATGSFKKVAEEWRDLYMVAGRKSDEEMLRVKMCEHIAEGEEGWNRPECRNVCPSTMAVAELRDKYEELLKRESAQPVDISNVKPGTLPINIDEALEALHTQYQFCGDAIISRRSPEAPTDIQLSRIRGAHLNIIPILKALKAAMSPVQESAQPVVPPEGWLWVMQPISEMIGDDAEYWKLHQPLKRESGGWQPIETAPEATKVLVWLPNYGVVVAQYTTHAMQQCWWDQERRIYPIEWMPYPEPPERLMTDKPLECE